MVKAIFLSKTYLLFYKKNIQCNKLKAKVSEKMKIVFICTGNTCRSPMAEGIMKKKIEQLKLDIECESAGLCAFSGDAPSENAVKAAAAFGADISSHRARAVSHFMFDGESVFVCMTPSHKKALSAYVPEQRLLCLGDIPDPYGGDEQVYMAAAKKIDEGLDMLIQGLFSFRILPMTQQDVAFVAETEKECFSSPWSEQGIKAELSNENARFFVAKSLSDSLGYIGMHIVLDECYIANVAVPRRHRRKGIGEALVSHALSIAGKEGCVFVSLEVRPSNTSAVALYEKLGFKRAGIRKSFYTSPAEDGLIMTKELK